MLLSALSVISPAPAFATTVTNSNWSVTYVGTDGDGLQLTSASFNGVLVFARSTLAFIDVVYPGHPGCCHDDLSSTERKSGPNYGTFSGGFHISATYCFGPCTPYDAIDSFSYKYVENYFFYSSGEWLARLDLYGPGLYSPATYNAYWRVDYDITDYADDQFQAFESGAWRTKSIEATFCDDGNHNSLGYEWRQSDLSPVRRYSVTPPALSSSRSGCDAAVVYNSSELDDFPSAYENGQSINTADIVQWYVGSYIYTRPAGCGSGGGGCTTSYQIGFSADPTGY
jgi:hypothetical protein